MRWLQGLLKEPAATPPEATTPPVSPPEGTVPPIPEAAASPFVEAVVAAIVDEPQATPPVPATEPTVPVAAPAVDLAPLILGLADLGAQQQELRKIFENRMRSDEVQGKALEKLHDELQQYKTNFVRQSLTPLLKEVIFCHDFIVQQADKLKQPEQESTPEAAHKALDAVQQMLLDLLFKFDVEPFRHEIGSGAAFDPRTQQCLKTIPTDQPDLDKRIAQPGACGFRAGESILRRELVMVYKYSADARPTDTTTTRSTP